MGTMREKLINIRRELLQLTDGEKFEAEHFVNEVLERLYERQVRDDQKLDICAVALRYDELTEYYHVIPWDCKAASYLSNGESSIPEKLLDIILKLARRKGVCTFSEDEAEELGIIPEETSVNELEEKWGWKDPREPRKKEQSNTQKGDKSEEMLKKDWYLLFDVSMQRESAKEPQKKMG